MAETELELLCIGNALVDVFARTEKGEEGDTDPPFGLDKPVQHIDIEKLKEIAARLPGARVVSGGGAANTAKIAGFLGFRTGFIGAVGAGPEGGTDRFGGVFAEDLAAAGVNAFLAKKPSPTGICLVLKTGTGKTVTAAAPSAALELSPEDWDEKLIKSAKVVMIDGFMLERKNLITHILDQANKYGTVAALDVGSASLVRDHAWEIATYSRIYPLILFMNQEEAAAFYLTLSRREGAAEQSLSREISGFFTNFTAANLFPIVAVKLGKRGAVVFAGGSVYREETIPIVPSEATGAGDAFSAAFLGAWIRGKSLSECAALGNHAAREVLNVPGTQVDPKKLKHLIRRLRSGRPKKV
jgi:sugar/nucleoside kinase (ribokinase family)